MKEPKSFSAPNVYLQDLPSAATYTIKTDGTYVWAVRYDGYIAFSGTDAATVIQSAINALTPERTWNELIVTKVKLTLTLIGALFFTLSIPSAIQYWFSDLSVAMAIVIAIVFWLAFIDYYKAWKKERNLSVLSK